MELLFVLFNLSDVRTRPFISNSCAKPGFQQGVHHVPLTYRQNRDRFRYRYRVSFSSAPESFSQTQCYQSVSAPSVLRASIPSSARRAVTTENAAVAVPSVPPMRDEKLP